MLQTPYDYSTRTDIYPVSWQMFHSLCKGLTQAVAPFNPQLILTVGRGGYYPGTLISHILQAEIYPIRLTRRVNDVVVREHPHWLVEPPTLVAGQRVLVVDEISSTGETLRVVKEKVVAMGAEEVKTAVLYSHTWGSHIPDYIGLISDALLLNPWDREILRDGQFQFHPEYVDALAQQGIPAEPSLLVDAPPINPAKSIVF